MERKVSKLKVGQVWLLTDIPGLSTFMVEITHVNKSRVYYQVWNSLGDTTYFDMPVSSFLSYGDKAVLVTSKHKKDFFINLWKGKEKF